MLKCSCVLKRGIYVTLGKDGSIIGVTVDGIAMGIVWLGLSKVSEFDP